jgi:hypothetical protein
MINTLLTAVNEFSTTKTRMNIIKVIRFMIFKIKRFFGIYIVTRIIFLRKRNNNIVGLA